MKNSIRFLSRALTGAFVTLTLLGQSLLGQVSTINITYPTVSTTIEEGQNVSFAMELGWETPAVDNLEVYSVYEGVPTQVDIINLLGTELFAGFNATIPELTGVSNQITYLVLSTGGEGRGSITLTVGEGSPVAGSLGSINIEYPEENASVSVTEPINISATVTPIDLTRFTSVDFYANGYIINKDPVKSQNGFFNYSWTEPWVGNIRITARATLNNGTFVETTVPRRFNVRAVGSAPEIQIEAVDGTNNVIGGSNKAFTVHVNDSGSLIETVDLYVNGEVVSSKGPGEYPFVFEMLMPQYGIIEVWAIAEFSNGNRARTETLRYVLNTGSAPTTTLLSPINGANFLPGTNVPIFATAYDPDSLITKIDLFVNDTYVQSIARGSDGNFSIFQSTYILPFAGDYRVFVQAMDETGRMTRSNVAVVQAGAPDESVPVAMIVHPLPVGGGDTLNDVSVGSDSWFNVKATDGDGSIRSVKFFVNGQLIGETSYGLGDYYAFHYKFRNSGMYSFYAQAIDNHGKVGQSDPLQVEVSPIEAFLPSVYVYPIDEAYQDVPLVESSIPIRVRADGGLAGISQLSLYVNGVYQTGMEPPATDSGVVDTVFQWVPNIYGQVEVSVRAHQIEPNTLPTDNWVVSNSQVVRIAPPSQNVAFVQYVVSNLLCGYLYEEFLDSSIGWTDGYYSEIVRALDNGQRSQAEFVHELMMQGNLIDVASTKRPAVTYSRVKNALMIRWALTGQWPTASQMASDVEMIRQLGESDEGSGERRVVRLLLPAFQMKFFGGKAIPDSFSSDAEFEEFIKVLFDRKYGVSPTKAQLDRCITVLRMGGTEWFVRDFILDEDAMRFGSGTVSTLLGIPNPPNHRLANYANSASLFVGLLKIVPLQSDVESRANLPLIEQIQIILDAMPAI